MGGRDGFGVVQVCNGSQAIFLFCDPSVDLSRQSFHIILVREGSSDDGADTAGDFIREIGGVFQIDTAVVIAGNAVGDSIHAVNADGSVGTLTALSQLGGVDHVQHAAAAPIPVGKLAIFRDEDIRTVRRRVQTLVVIVLVTGNVLVGEVQNIGVGCLIGRFFCGCGDHAGSDHGDQHHYSQQNRQNAVHVSFHCCVALPFNRIYGVALRSIVDSETYTALLPPDTALTKNQQDCTRLFTKMCMDIILRGRNP